MSELKALKGIVPEIEMVDSYCKKLVWCNPKEHQQIEITKRTNAELISDWNSFVDSHALQSSLTAAQEENRRYKEIIQEIWSIACDEDRSMKSVVMDIRFTCRDALNGGK